MPTVLAANVAIARGRVRTTSHTAPSAPKRASTRCGARKSNGASESFADWLRREIDITFNPRTPGAKIAGRCPDTQIRPSEVDHDRLGAMEEEAEVATRDDFDIRAFTAQLERAMTEGGEAVSAAPRGDARSAVVTKELADDNEAVVEDDGFDYDVVEEESEGPLSGRELALLCIKKYGKAHDMAIKHVKMGSGMKRWVSLNLYVGHLGQRSYPQTEAQYLEQLDVIAYLINSWNQEDYTRAFFREKPIARRGLPSRPRVDTCVTLQFARSPTWNDELTDEYFEF